jgi:hypothetical protein
MKYVASLLVLVVVGFSVTEANAGLFRLKRSAKCTSCSSCSVTTKSAVQKDAAQKDTAVQKDAVQKEEATQKEAVQKEATQKETKAVVVTKGSALYNICLRKAQIQASRGRCFHPGGSFGGCHAEGVGMAMSAQGALNNCCFTGKRKCAAMAVVKGAGGRFYACKLFW